MTGPIQGSSYNQSLKEIGVGNIASVPTTGKTNFTYVDKKQVENDPNAKVLDLTGLKPDALQSKEKFLQALGQLETNGDGLDVIKVRLSTDSGTRGEEVYISLNSLTGVPSGQPGVDMRQKMVNSLMNSVDKLDKSPTMYFKELTLELPSYVMPNNQYTGNKAGGSIAVGQDAGGLTTWVGTQDAVVKQQSISIQAQDLSSIADLNDPKVTSLVDGVTSLCGGKVVTTDINVTELTPTNGFNLGSSKGQEQLRDMLDGYLKSGKFNKDLYNQQDAAGQQYRNTVQQGLKNLMGDGFEQLKKRDPPVQLPQGITQDNLAQKMADILFTKDNLTPNDVKIIQAGFAVMANNSQMPGNGFAKILAMSNPNSGETPSNSGIDGIPATRFAVVTSTLFSGLNQQITKLNPPSSTPVYRNFNAMADEIGKDKLKNFLHVDHLPKGL